MNFKVIKEVQGEVKFDTLVLAVNEDFCLEELNRVNSEASIIASDLVKEGVFSGKAGELISFRLTKENAPKKAVLIGLGRKGELCLEKLRRAFGQLYRECSKLKSTSIGIYMLGIEFKADLSIGESSRAIAEGIILASYSFDQYKAEKKQVQLENIFLVCGDEEQSDELRNGLLEGETLGEAVALARDLVNEPANTLTPNELALRAKNEGIQSGFEVEVFDEVKIQELGMKAFYEVAKGSKNPPRLIVMRYFGNPENKENILGIVGKGLTYDSGGYAIKSLEGMVGMKSDMAGSAAVVGAMKAIAKQRLAVNVVAIVAACENMISGDAYKNGDVIGSMAGKTIEIKSTDAEGRLTLADAVYYAIEKENVKKVVDIATLTGAAGVALGNVCTGIITNNDEFFNVFEQATIKTGEKVWKLPTFEEYRELLKSDIADLKNSGGRMAGTIVGGLFIGEFVKETPWIHMDIAATAGSDRDFGYVAKGGTGVGVRTLYELAKSMK